MSRPAPPPDDAARNAVDPRPVPARTPVDEALAAQAEALRDVFPMPPARAPRASRGPRVLGLAATALAVAGAVAWADPAWQREHHATAPGEHRVIGLRDESRLTLDGATEVSVAWHLRSRRVTLHQGRVRSAVAPSAWRPFVIDAGLASVQVLGTVFDVERHTGRVAVTVLRGRVQVQPAGEGSRRWVRQLVAGQQVEAIVRHGATGDSIAWGEVRPFDGEGELDAATAWADGRLVFRRSPLADVVRQLQRQRAGEIRLHGDATAELEVTGVFAATRADQVIDLLPRVLPVSVQRQADGSVDIRAR